MVTITLYYIKTLVTNIYLNVRGKNYMTLIAAETDSAINNSSNKTPHKWDYCGMNNGMVKETTR